MIGPTVGLVLGQMRRLFAPELAQTIYRIADLKGVGGREPLGALVDLVQARLLVAHKISEERDRMGERSLNPSLPGHHLLVLFDNHQGKRIACRDNGCWWRQQLVTSEQFPAPKGFSQSAVTVSTIALDLLPVLCLDALRVNGKEPAREDIEGQADLLIGAPLTSCGDERCCYNNAHLLGGQHLIALHTLILAGPINPKNAAKLPNGHTHQALSVSLDQDKQQGIFIKGDFLHLERDQCLLFGRVFLFLFHLRLWYPFNKLFILARPALPVQFKNWQCRSTHNRYIPISSPACSDCSSYGSSGPRSSRALRRIVCVQMPWVPPWLVFVTSGVTACCIQRP